MYVYEIVLLLHFLCDSKKIIVSHLVIFLVNVSKTITPRHAAGLLSRKHIIILEIFAKLTVTDVNKRCDRSQFKICLLPIGAIYLK